MNVYFSGIGGVGIGPLAEIAYDAGYSVFGSDRGESLITKQLDAKGIKICLEQDGSFLKKCHQLNPIDWFVYTSALPDEHPELLLAKSLGIKTSKRDEFLSNIIKEKGLKLIAISGTHGKTTSTGIMIWTMKQLGIPISYSIGTTISFGKSGVYDPASEYFIYECDEYDNNFLQFSPYLSIIPSIDYDHPDVFPTRESYDYAFRKFASQSQHVISWQDQSGDIFSGLQNITMLNSSDINQNIKLAGIHNRRNASLVQAGLKRIGIKQDTDHVINNFPGTDRRFEKLADNLYTDYGHHPTEIAATLQLASELSDQVVLVYQPHQNIRQHEVKDQYTNVFEKASEIYWLPTYLSREDPNLPILKPEELTAKVSNQQIITIVDFNNELWDRIQQKRTDGKLVLLMGAGEIDEWARDNLAKNHSGESA